jgi:chloride channel protein, CIC family
VGYENLEELVAGTLAGRALMVLVALKLVSWIIALGSGTSGGTLAPLFTIGGGVGALAGGMLSRNFPGLGVDPRIAALVGMAAIFAGASHAVLASVVFVFETTRQPLGLLPLLAGCSAAYLVSLLGMRHSIMTEKLARRGTRIRSEYAADYLEQVLVREIATTDVVTLSADEPVEEVRDRIAARMPGSQHQGFPVVNPRGELVGVVTRRDLLDRDLEVIARVGELVSRAVVVIYADSSAREAADHMVHERVGRLPVVTRQEPRRVVGIVSRSDLLEAHERRLHARHRVERTIDLSQTLGWVRPTER